MASVRDAMRRLDVIYQACAPEAVAENGGGDLDEFTRTKKKIHSDVKAVRLALKEREELVAKVGTTTETAEISYKIRSMIKNLKEDAARISELQQKDARKKKLESNELEKRREVVDLCYRHIEEIEQLEKKRFNDRMGGDRLALFTKSDGQSATANGGIDSLKSNPYTSSEIPDIDVEEDLKLIKSRNKQIDNELEDISQGVKRLKDLASDMNNELERQNDGLADIDRKVEKVLDHMDNVNVKMKKTVEGLMKGDRFLMNCILLCVLLSLVGYIVSNFTN